MAVNLTRLLVLSSVFCWLAGTAGTVNISKVKEWAKNVGGNLTDFFHNVTSFNKLQEAYNQTSQLSVRKRNGTTIVNDMKIHLQDVLQKKIKSIKKLAEKTAGLRKNYSYESPLKPKEVKYFNSKDIKDLPLQIDPTFSLSIKINRNTSVVHIPTDVYSGGIKILNTIKWTDGMDQYFKENDKEDPTLLWQFFGSSDGVYRVYPGFKWPDESENDVFDSRRRGWYIQGSSSPKDIVLLLDLSGSMAGQKLSIVRLAAMSLLETLQENDFVNIVIMYKNDDKSDNNDVQPYMVCQVQKDGSVEKSIEKVENCSDQLLQATQQNKKYLRSFVPNIKARGIAAVSEGFKKAIEVLTNSEKKMEMASSGCTQAIILFTDGIEDNQAKKTSDILRDYNSDKKIRVFTYLVGREKSTTDKPLKEISSEYGGCSFRIKTLSDVREKVLEYVKVLSSPLGFAIADTGPDPSWTPIYLDKLGLGLMITLVAPVFNKTGTKGELLGVVGTDVALPLLEASIPGSEVGVNGYGFAINNNGFVLFHPDLDKKKDPPNIALDELEYNATGAKELTKKMIDRETGNMRFQNRLISEHKHRLSRSDEFHYFYSPIENTSFSAAVAIPNRSLYFIDAPNLTELNKEFLKSSDNNEFVILAPWKFCPNTSVAAEGETPVYLTAYPTAQDILRDTDLTKNCADQKSRNLFFDANLTKEAAAKWTLGNGIENIFVATHGGVMRWLNSSVLASPPERDYIKEEFYTQAAQYADKGKNIVVFSAPYRAPNYQAEMNETASITASSAVVVTNTTVVAAVAGMHVKQDVLKNLVLDSIGSDECNDTTECEIRVVDDDGFIVASNQDDDSEVGKFFGVMEGVVLRNFLNRSLFEALTFTSVQEECEKSKNTGQSSARTLLNPLFAVTSYVQFWTQTVFWSLAQFNIYSFFSQGVVAMADEEEKDNMIQCTKELKFYKAHGGEQVFDVPCENPESCPWHVYVAPVPDTNLRLVVVKKRCPCNVNQRLTTTGSPLTSDQPLPGIVSYRKAPEFKPPCSVEKDLNEGKPPCALASLTSPHSVTTVVLLVLAVFVNNWR